MSDNRSFDQILGDLTAFVRVLRLARMPSDFYQVVISDLDFRDWLVEAVREKRGLTYCETAQQKEARQRMDGNFHGIPEVERCFGEMTNEERRRATVIPDQIMNDISNMLDDERGKYILFYDTGIPIVGGMCQILARRGLIGIDRQTSKRTAASRTEAGRWRLMRMTPLHGSTSLQWEQQLALVNSEVDEIPLARQVAYMALLHFRSTGKRLFDAMLVRTSDPSVSGEGYAVGLPKHYYPSTPDQPAVRVRTCYHQAAGPDICIITARKTT